MNIEDLVELEKHFLTYFTSSSAHLIFSSVQVNNRRAACVCCNPFRLLGTCAVSPVKCCCVPLLSPNCLTAQMALAYDSAL